MQQMGEAQAGPGGSHKIGQGSFLLHFLWGCNHFTRNFVLSLKEGIQAREPSSSTNFYSPFLQKFYRTFADIFTQSQSYLSTFTVEFCVRRGIPTEIKLSVGKFIIVCLLLCRLWGLVIILDSKTNSQTRASYQPLEKNLLKSTVFCKKHSQQTFTIH